MSRYAPPPLASPVAHPPGPFRLPGDTWSCSAARDQVRSDLLSNRVPEKDLAAVDAGSPGESDARAAAAVRWLTRADDIAVQRRVAALARARVGRDRGAGVYWSPVHDALWAWHAVPLPPAPDRRDAKARPTPAGVGLDTIADPETLELVAGAYGPDNLERLAAWARDQTGDPGAVAHLLSFQADAVWEVAIAESPDVTPGFVDAAVQAGRRWGARAEALVQLAWRVPAGSAAWARLDEAIRASTLAGPGPAGARPPVSLPVAARLAEVLRARSGARRARAGDGA